MIKITDIAAKKMNELIDEKRIPQSAMLRISFGGFGWGGPTLQVTLDESKNRNDVLIETQGIKIVYEADLKNYVRDSIIDYSKNWFNKGFVLIQATPSAC